MVSPPVLSRDNPAGSKAEGLSRRPGAAGRKGGLAAAAADCTDCVALAPPRNPAIGYAEKTLPLRAGLWIIANPNGDHHA
jgi:hypothetical protein